MLLTQQLKHLREKNGYSQTDLAYELDISRQSVSKWERGENFPDINNLLRLSELYNVSLDELVRGSQFLRRPFDWYPDNFGLRLYLKDQRQIYLPLKQNFTQYLPQFILSLKKKGIVTSDDYQLQIAIMNKENLYTYMEKRLNDGDVK